MNPKWNRFAPYGIYLSILAALSALGFYIYQNSFSLGVQISLAVLVIGLAAFVILDPERVRVALTGRQAKYGSNIFVMGVALLGILVVVNVVAFKNSPKWDLTEDKTHTLSKETIDLLKSLKEPVQATAFFTTRTSSEAARTLLDNYKNNSGGKFAYTFIDPEANPSAAADITRDGTIVFSMDGRKEQVTYADETEFSTAIIKLANPGNRVVYFLTGDGEYDPEGTEDQTSYSTVKNLLGNKSYSVKTLNLIATPSIPEDALTIIIVAPKNALTDQEVSLLKAYVDKGHSLVVFQEPSILNKDGGAAGPLEKYLTDEWGITLDNDLIIDRTMNPVVIAATNQYGNHSITQKLQGMATVFPEARSLTVAATAPKDVTVTKLALTSEYAWGETDVASISANQVKEDAGKDIQGPLTLAATAENSTTKGRVVVVGDADFASNYYAHSYGNSDFAVNSIDWAAQQENLINITPKSSTQRVLVPPQRYMFILLFIGLVIVLPGLAIAFGIYAWALRRRRG
jgi:ABC-type uncharacterized transport system involved in gliding motility auxiliary subunit